MIELGSLARSGLSLIAAHLCAGALVIEIADIRAPPALVAAIKASERGHVREAIKLLTPLADSGNADAECQLGFLYEMGAGVPRDHDRGMAWYRKAAVQGNARGQYLLGVSDTDQTRGSHWITKAAVQGLDVAQITLGSEYEFGWGVPQDATEAAKWYRKSADQGNGNAQVSLARMYEDGRGVPKNLLLAYAWVSRAHRTSPEDGLARAEVRRIAAEMTPEQVAEAERWSREGVK